MPIVPLNFALSTLTPEGRSDFFTERMVNMMAEQPGQGGNREFAEGRRSWTAKTVPGVKPPYWERFKNDVLTGHTFRPRRAPQDGQSLLVVTETNLYFCAETGAIHDLGRFRDADGNGVTVSDPEVADDGFSAIVIDRTSGLAWQLQHPASGGLDLERWTLRFVTEDLAPGLPGKFGGIKLNSGRYLVTEKGTDRMRYSYVFGQFDPAGGGVEGDIFPPNFDITAESDSDTLLSIEVNERAVYLFGERTVELFYPDPQVVYQQATGGAMRRGCASPDATASLGTHVFWLDDACQLWTTDSFKPRMVSQPAHSRAIRHALGNDLRRARMSAHSWNGHDLVCIHTPIGAFVYDHSTGFWHERSGMDSPAQDAPPKPWPVIGVYNAYGKSWALLKDGVGEYAEEVYRYGDGRPFLRRVQTMPVDAFPNLVNISWLQLLADFTADDAVMNSEPLRVALWIHGNGELPSYHGDAVVSGGNERLFFKELGTGTFLSFDFRVVDGNRPFTVFTAALDGTQGDEDASAYLAARSQGAGQSAGHYR